MITNYATLKAAVADWLNRADLTDQIPTFIQLAEAGLNRDMRTRSMVVRADAPIDSQYTTLPLDYLEMTTLYLRTSPVTKLQFLTQEEMQLKKSQGYPTSGTPRYFSVVGTSMEVLPAPDSAQTAEMIYYGKTPTLSDSNTTNWLLTAHPDIYLWSSLISSAPYLRDDGRIETWRGLLGAAMDSLVLANSRQEFSGGVVKVRSRSY